MSSSRDTPTLPLADAIRTFANHQNALQRAPRALDILTLLRRLELSSEQIAQANASLTLLESEQDTRHVYLILATLSDEVIQASTGPLPSNALSAIMSAAQRLAPRMQSRETLQNPALQEELFRQLAAQLGWSIEDERPATSSYLLRELDGVLKQMHAHRAEYDTALQRAKEAIDTKHRPARPYGE